jgi:1-phosphofructokinase family hexose kinase
MSNRDCAPAGHSSERLRRLVCVSLSPAIDKIVAVDHLVAGEIHRPDTLSAVPGGKALNAARAAACLGLSVVVVAVLAGHMGTWMEEALAGYGVAVRSVRVPGETRTCLSILDRSTGWLTEFYEVGLPIDAAAWATVEAAIAAEVAPDPAGTLVACSGSLPPLAPVDAYGRIVALAARAGARAAVDVGGEPLARAVAARPWLVKVNAREAADATGLPAGGEAETLAAARALRGAGASVAFVTRGVDGAVVVDEAGEAWRIGPPPERGPYPVGSGDSVLGGFLVGIAAGESVAEAARRGSAAGAVNALHPGQGMLDPADVARLELLVALERLDG